MKIDKKMLRLYLVTDRSWLGENSLVSQVEKSLTEGVTFLQLREKSLDDKSFLDLAIEMKKQASQYNIPFVINDNIDIALQSKADGVHIGQDDMPVDEARKMLGEDKILGVSVRTVKQAVEAEKFGADYLGVGAVFSTDTKKDAQDVSYEMLSNICKSVDIPVVAIGGINKDNILLLENSGICGVAVVSAILAQKNIEKATDELRNICDGLFQ